ncbi:MAG: thermonuclease family protein [Alphaproteobacteria bacterium]|nr:thermonuclease family protein [Alphaproteobacteria bacterium]
MFWLKKIVLGLGLLVLIYGGSAGTQSSSLFIQAMSFIGLLFLGVILFIFARMLLRGLGCLPSLLIMLSIGVFMMYTLGMFNNGLSGTLSSVSKFIGRETNEQQPVLEQNEEHDEPVLQGAPSEQKQEQEEPEEPSAALFEDYEPKEPQAPKQNLLGNVMSALRGSAQEPQEQRPFNPQNYPPVYVTPRVLSGDTLEVYGHYFKLFGVAAPEISQTCANRQGKPYNCGKEAALWLKDWIDGGELECHIIDQDSSGNMIGTCSYGPYDLGAALVNAGWAVAYTKYTDAYSPYELQAQQNKRGLWQGRFYMPWDWRKIQQRKATVKIIRPKKKKVGIFG